MTRVVGFIGAGQMGEPMVERLLGAGHKVRVYARRSDVCDRLRERGATLAGSIAELSECSDVLISCVFDDGQLYEISSGPDGVAARARPGAVLVSHTTGQVGTLNSIQASAPELQIVDAPVSGTSADIAKGQLTVLIGGPAAAVERVTPVLSAYANPIVATGGLGTALGIKLINNLLFAANIQMLGAAVDLAEELSILEARLLDALAVCSGGSRAADYMRGYGGAKVLATGISPVIFKDLAACASAAEEAGIDLGLLLKVNDMGPFAWASGK
jgi:3-hydroxyisobutyrate dehydrogenase-like beta-hydroxyacid dehydrogenase